jgi:hypothetical protein
MSIIKSDPATNDPATLKELFITKQGVLEMAIQAINEPMRKNNRRPL